MTIDHNKIVLKQLKILKEDNEIFTDFDLLTLEYQNEFLENKFFLYLSTNSGFIYQFDLQKEQVISKTRVTDKDIDKIMIDGFNERIFLSDCKGQLTVFGLDLL